MKSKKRRREAEDHTGIFYDFFFPIGKINYNEKEFWSQKSRIISSLMGTTKEEDEKRRDCRGAQSGRPLETRGGLSGARSE